MSSKARSLEKFRRQYKNQRGFSKHPFEWSDQQPKFKIPEIPLLYSPQNQRNLYPSQCDTNAKLDLFPYL